MHNAPNPLLREAAGLAPELEGAFSTADLLRPARFETTFRSKAYPVLDGPLVVRLPTFGETVEIANRSRHGGIAEEARQTLRLCLEKAPDSWYHLPPGSKLPELNLDALPDAEGVLELWVAFDQWRSALRA
ncbi:MAG: hypothetical protein HYZ13_09230 [Acidobacteria bacterium]|nr:hypothetical protein [Acidobacteriota bacterium]